MAFKIFAAAIVIRILAETDLMVLAYNLCLEESTTWHPITILAFLIRSTFTSKIILRGTNWNHFTLVLYSYNKSFLNTFMEMRASSSFKNAFVQNLSPLYWSNWAASFAFLGTLMLYFSPLLLGTRQSFPPGFFSLARRNR